jgi:4-hydroxymandelate synthase
VADSVAPDRSSLLLQQGAARLVVTSGPATWKFLDAHGAGIADIALVCTDVTATAERALRAGARRAGRVRGNPILSGAGGVTHTLLPAARTPRGWSGGHRWVELPPRPGPTGRVRQLNGVAIGLGGARLKDCVRLYQEGFGLVPRRSERASESGLPSRAIELGGLQAGMTLTLVADEPGADSRRVAAQDPVAMSHPVQQLSFLVDDIVLTARELRADGAGFGSPVLEAGRGGQRGRLHLVGRLPHLGEGLSLELVQHSGPGGFGPDDVQALHAAVDQYRMATG